MEKATSKASPVDRVSNTLLSDLINVGKELLGEPTLAERAALNKENEPFFGDDLGSVDSDTSFQTAADAGAPPSQNNKMARQERGQGRDNGNATAAEEIASRGGSQKTC